MQRILLTLSLLILSCVLTASADEGVEVVQQVGGALHGMVMDGNAVLLAEGSTLTRLSLSGAAAYQPQARLPLPAPILSLERDATGIFALTEEGVYSLSADGSAIIHFLPGSGDHLAVSANFVAVAAQAAGVRLLQRQADGTLSAGVFIDTPGTAQQVAFSPQGWLAVADGIGGLRVYDPATGNLRRAIPDVAPARLLEIMENRLYVSDGTHITLIDATTPENLQIIGQYAPAQQPIRAAISGAWALLEDQHTGLKVYSLPTAAYQASETKRPGVDVVIVNNSIISASQDGLHVYDASRLPALVEINRVALSAPPLALAVEMQQQWLLVALEGGGLNLRRLSDLADLGTLPVTGRIVDLVIDSQIAFLLMHDGRLVAFDLLTETVLGAMEISGQPQMIEAASGTALVASGAAGVYVVQLGRMPRQIVRLPAHDFAHAVAPTEDGRWLVQDGDRLRLLDAQWQPIAQQAVSGHTLASTNGWVIAAGEQEVTALTADLAPLARYTTPHPINGMQALPGELLLSSPDAGLIRLDVRDPANPREIDRMNTGITHFAVQGEDVLAITSAGYFEHFRQGERQGRYLPLTDLHQVTPADDQLLLIGDATFWLAADHTHQPAYFENMEQVVRVGEQWVGLDQAGSIHFYDRAGTWQNTLTDITATALTAHEATLWIAQADGGISRWQNQQMSLFTTTSAYWTHLLWAHETLYGSTASGDIWRWSENPHMVSIGAPISDLALLSDGSIGVLAGDLWRLNANLAMQPAIPVHGEGRALAVTPGMVAVGSSCGVEIFEAAGWERRGYRLQAGVRDVTFWEEDIWIAGQNGLTALRISPEMVQLPQPYAPQPADQAILNRPVSQLRWLPLPSTCEDYQYEVSVNGQVVATLSQPIYVPPAPLERSTRWQVTLISPDGARISSPEWRINLDTQGWLAVPQTISLLEENEAPGQMRLSLLVGGMIIGCSLIGLGWLWRRNKKQWF